MIEFLDLIKEYGIWAGLALFLIWKDQNEKTELARRLGLLEDFTKHTLMTVVKECHSTIERNNELLELRRKEKEDLEKKIAEEKKKHESFNSY